MLPCPPDGAATVNTTNKEKEARTERKPNNRLATQARLDFFHIIIRITKRGKKKGNQNTTESHSKQPQRLAARYE